MAVYTKINNKEVSFINKKFEIDKIINFRGIKQGIENTNYLLISKNKKFVFSIPCLIPLNLIILSISNSLFIYEITFLLIFV